MPHVEENICKRNDGCFEGHYIKGHDENGRIKQGSVYCYDEVKKQLDIQKKKACERCFADMTFAEVADEWKQEKFDQLAPSTRGMYLLNLNRHLLPVLRDEKISNLTVKRIDDLTLEIIRRAEETGKPLASNTQRFNRSLIGTIVGYARAKDNPQDDRPMEIADNRKSYEVLEEWEIEKICVGAKYDHSLVKLAILLMLFVGVRSGEICALDWDDVDPDTGEIYISKTAHRVPLCEKMENGAKTAVVVQQIPWKNQIRTEKAPRILVPYIQEFHTPGRSMMTGLVNTPMEQRTLMWRFDRIMDSLGLKNINAQRLHKTWQKGRADVKILERVFAKTVAPKSPDAESLNFDERTSLVADSAIIEEGQTDIDPVVLEAELLVPAIPSKPNNETGIEWGQINHGVLMHRMAAEICFLRADLGMSTGEVSEISGIPEEKICAVERGEQNFSWTEYLSLLFLFWCDDRSRHMVVEKKLFPEELMGTMSTNGLKTDRKEKNVLPERPLEV